MQVKIHGQIKCIKEEYGGNLSHAKAHIAQHITYYRLYEEDIRNYLDSDFIIINEDYSMTTEPVSNYVLLKLKEYINKYKNKTYVKDGSIEICEKLISEYSK